MYCSNIRISKKNRAAVNVSVSATTASCQKVHEIPNITAAVMAGINLFSHSFRIRNRFAIDTAANTAESRLILNARSPRGICFVIMPIKKYRGCERASPRFPSMSLCQIL